MSLGNQIGGEILVSFTPLKSSVTLHEPVFVDFSIQNGLAEKMNFDLGHNQKSGFAVSVIEPNGSTVQATPLSDWDLGRAGDFTLDPAGVYRQRLLLNEWYPFKAAGNYKVEIKLTTPVTDSLGRTVEARAAQPFMLIVQPTEPAKLAQICQSLARKAIESTDVEEGTNAGLVLSHVIDPIAVPYLQQVLNHSRLASAEAATGLGRIASQEAVEALIEAFRDPDSKGHARAGSVLNQVMKRIEDPSLKSMIEGVLES